MMELLAFFVAAFLLAGCFYYLLFHREDGR